MGKIFPMIVSIVTLALAVPLLLTMFRAAKPSAVLHDSELAGPTERSEYYFLGWVVAMLGAVAFVGFPFGCALFIYAFILAYRSSPPAKRHPRHRRRGVPRHHVAFPEP